MSQPIMMHSPAKGMSQPIMVNTDAADATAAVDAARQQLDFDQSSESPSQSPSKRKKKSYKKVGWTLAEQAKVLQMIRAHGISDWQAKANVLGTGRTGNSVYPWYLAHGRHDRGEIERELAASGELDRKHPAAATVADGPSPGHAEERKLCPAAAAASARNEARNETRKQARGRQRVHKASHGGDLAGQLMQVRTLREELELALLEVSHKALSLPCTSTVFLSKTVPFCGGHGCGRRSQAGRSGLAAVQIALSLAKHEQIQVQQVQQLSSLQRRLVSTSVSSPLEGVDSGAGREQHDADVDSSEYDEEEQDGEAAMRLPKPLLSPVNRLELVLADDDDAEGPDPGATVAACVGSICRAVEQQNKGLGQPERSDGFAPRVSLTAGGQLERHSPMRTEGSSANLPQPGQLVWTARQCQQQQAFMPPGSPARTLQHLAAAGGGMHHPQQSMSPGPHRPRLMPDSPSAVIFASPQTRASALQMTRLFSNPSPADSATVAARGVGISSVATSSPFSSGQAVCALSQLSGETAPNSSVHLSRSL
eukprot:SAG22_NODE_1053_length_5796_cov_8.764613_2_plen_538_part_00